MCYLEWHQICRASESASDLKSCDLYESIDRQWSIKDKVYHVGVTRCSRPYSKSLSLLVCETGSVPLGIRTLVLLVRSKAIQLKVHGSWLRMSGSRQASLHNFLTYVICSLCGRNIA
jgi:hypothetical protein